MQSLRSTTLRRLCLSATASIARPPSNALFALSYRSRLFTSSSLRRDPGATQFYHETTEETRQETPSGVEEAESASPKTGSPKKSLFVANIPWSATEDDLRNIFSVYGPIIEVKIGKNAEGVPAGYCHVEFESKEDAVKVKEAHKESPMMIGDRQARIEYGRYNKRHGDGPPSPRRGVKERHEPSPVIYVGNVPHEATKSDILEVMKPLGDAKAVRISLDREGVSKGFAHVEFTTTAEAETVLEHYQRSAIYVLGRELRLDRAKRAETAYQPSPRLYFTGWQGNASSLRTHFRALRSKIVDVHIRKSPDPNVLTGSGFVEFRDLETANEAIARFNTPELSLAYARSDPHSRPRRTERERGTRNDTNYGIKKQGGRRDLVE